MKEPDKRREGTVADRERSYFDAYHSREACHPRGVRLRMRRDAAVLLPAAGGSLGRVLSVGCGDALFELSLCPNATEVVGIDLSVEAIERAQQHAAERGINNARFTCVSATEYADPNPFDTVLCISFLHHLPIDVRPAFLRTLSSILAPGGLLFATEPNARGGVRRLGRWLMGRSYDAYHSEDEVELDPEETRAEFKAAGFASTRLLAIDWTLIAATHLLANRPGWPLGVCAAVDRALLALAPAGWATGFAVVARRDGVGSAAQPA